MKIKNTHDFGDGALKAVQYLDLLLQGKGGRIVVRPAQLFSFHYCLCNCAAYYRATPRHVAPLLGEVSHRSPTADDDTLHLCVALHVGGPFLCCSAVLRVVAYIVLPVVHVAYSLKLHPWGNKQCSSSALT